jgi:hypothetical protein
MGRAYLSRDRTASHLSALPRDVNNLSKARWSWGCVAAVDSEGRTIWIVDAHRDNGKTFRWRANEKLTAFLELERAICLRLLSKHAKS